VELAKASNALEIKETSELLFMSAELVLTEDCTNLVDIQLDRVDGLAQILLFNEKRAANRRLCE